MVRGRGVWRGSAAAAAARAAGGGWWEAACACAVHALLQPQTGEAGSCGGMCPLAGPGCALAATTPPATAGAPHAVAGPFTAAPNAAQPGCAASHHTYSNNFCSLSSTPQPEALPTHRVARRWPPASLPGCSQAPARLQLPPAPVMVANNSDILRVSAPPCAAFFRLKMPAAPAQPQNSRLPRSLQSTRHDKRTPNTQDPPFAPHQARQPQGTSLARATPPPARQRGAVVAACWRSFTTRKQVGPRGKDAQPSRGCLGK
jgi:hypothetical protein